MKAKDKNNDMLTHRERDILKMISDGFTNRETARLLGLSTRTVEAHRARIMIKLGTHDIAGLVKHALRFGITDLNQHRPLF